MKRLALFFVVAGLFALAACDPLVGPMFQECSASNCPPPGTCQRPDSPIVGFSVCKTPPNASVRASVTTAALPATGRRE
jgi:hypothetical protein